ncbi:hypothetical protein [uncultured Xylophilus sp.]|uniref:hypothetical protein n=1 Tax=uncultured Xylophilus sp. TaxID=296832 RepID=UPI0025EEF5CC|nr:hypothetical protein [uncultured Xylophilus sp.]
MPQPPAVPRFIPTLTEVVAPPDADVEPAERPVAPSPSPAPTSQGQSSAALSDALREQILHRVLQRVDMLLAARLASAVEVVVQEQTIALLPRLRDEIGHVVQATLADALSHELPRRVAPTDRP